MSILQKVYARTFKWVAGTGAVLVFGFSSLPHLFPQKMVKIVHGLPHSSNDNVTPQYMNLLKETCKLMDIDPDRVELTYSRDFSTVSAGILSFPNKSVIALPRNAKYKHKDELCDAGIVFNQKPIDWESNIGKALQEVLILSENDIRFLIGHELTHIKNKDFLLSAVHGSTVIGVFYMLGNILPNILKQTSFHRIVLLNWLVWLSGIPFYYLTKRYMSHRMEMIADNNSARLNKTYCDGGIHYTRNRLKLNRILRSLHGVTGDSMFSKTGNNLADTYTHPPRSERLRKLKRISKEMGITLEEHV